MWHYLFEKFVVCIGAFFFFFFFCGSLSDFLELSLQVATQHQLLLCFSFAFLAALCFSF